MSKRIAPTLRQAILEPPWDPSQGPHEAACRELRALLAVVRAARGVRRYVLESGYEGLEGPADGTLFRALARLDRVSSPRATKGER